MRVLLAICLLLITNLATGQARRAENLIEKEKYETAHELLVSGMEKDSTDAALPFVLSTLYLTQAWPQANLDSAYYFSVLAINKYDQLDEKSLDRQIKDGFGKTRLVELKEKIDHLAYERAKGGDKEEDYQQFMDQHADASDLDSAIYFRDKRAFQKASALNSRSSYKYFLDNYKKANDWQEADARYQKILYYEMTGSGKLKEYVNFIDSYPKSPNFEQSVNEIYLIRAGENSTETLLDFVDKYPTTHAAQKAIGLLYHKHLEKEPASSFADKYPRIQLSDSLRQVISYQNKTLIPVWNNDLIRFIDLHQNIVIDSLTSIEPFDGTTDFISGKKAGKQVLLGKSGQVFYTGIWNLLTNLGDGFIALTENNKSIIVNENGSHFETGTNPQLLGPYIQFESNGKYGLVSVTGKPVSSAKYDSIWFQNGLIFLKQEEKVSPNLPETFYPALDGNTYKTGAFYEDFEWLGDTLLWVAGNNKEGLLNSQLETLVPFKKQRIDLAHQGWTISEKNKVQNPFFSNKVFRTFEENEDWQIATGKDSVLVKYNYTTTFRPDSAALLGPASIKMHFGDSTFVYLTDTIRIYNPKGSVIKPLLDQKNDAAFYEFSFKKAQSIFNRKGQALDLPKYIEILPLNSDFFLLKEKKLYTLYNKWGEKLLENLEGAAMINDSTLSILQEQKFGLYIPTDSVYIAPEFDKKPLPLTDSLWVVSKDNLLGVVSSGNHKVVPPKYEEINYWTNGLLFLKKDLKWNIYDLKASTFPETGVIKYQSIPGSKAPTIIYQKGVGMGVFSSEKGIVLRPTYSSVQKKGTPEQPYYLADKYVEEASLHVLLYYDLNGQLLFQKVISDNQYEGLFGKKE